MPTLSAHPCRLDTIAESTGQCNSCKGGGHLRRACDAISLSGSINSLQHLSNSNVFAMPPKGSKKLPSYD